MKERNTMNKIIPFTKVITLKERFLEIKKIALDDTLKLDDPYTIKGDLIVRGCYQKESEEEEFSYPIPVEIAIDAKYDTSKCNISIDDFYYEIINEQSIRVKIDLMLDDLYYNEEEKIDVSELVLEDNRNNEDEFQDEVLSEMTELETSSNNDKFVNNLLNDHDLEKASKLNNNYANNNLKDENVTNTFLQNTNNFQEQMNDLLNETKEEKEYSIYRVYVVGEGETLEYIMDKYKVTKEDLTPFNDLENLQTGMKLIIPSLDE